MFEEEYSHLGYLFPNRQVAIFACSLEFQRLSRRESSWSYNPLSIPSFVVTSRDHVIGIDYFQHRPSDYRIMERQRHVTGGQVEGFDRLLWLYDDIQNGGLTRTEFLKYVFVNDRGWCAWDQYLDLSKEYIKDIEDQEQ